MSEMVERVADVLRTMGCGESYGCDEIARAAIVAMREPTDGMIKDAAWPKELGDDGSRAYPNDYRIWTCTEYYWCDWDHVWGDGRNAWRAMIDEALK